MGLSGQGQDWNLALTLSKGEAGRTQATFLRVKGCRLDERSRGRAHSHHEEDGETEAQREEGTATHRSQPLLRPPRLPGARTLFPAPKTTSSSVTTGAKELPDPETPPFLPPCLHRGTPPEKPRQPLPKPGGQDGCEARCPSPGRDPRSPPSVPPPDPGTHRLAAGEDILSPAGAAPAWGSPGSRARRLPRLPRRAAPRPAARAPGQPRPSGPQPPWAQASGLLVPTWAGADRRGSARGTGRPA